MCLSKTKKPRQTEGTIFGELPNVLNFTSKFPFSQAATLFLRLKGAENHRAESPFCEENWNHVID